MNELTIAATLVVAIIGAVLFVAWATRRERAQFARLRKEQKDAEAAMLVRADGGSSRVETKRRPEPGQRWARKLATEPLRPSYRSPAPAQSDDSKGESA